MGCNDIGRKERKLKDNKYSPNIINDNINNNYLNINDYNNNINNNNNNNEQSIKLLEQRLKEKTNKLNLNFEKIIKEINEKYKKSQQEEEIEYTSMKQKYDLKYKPEIDKIELMIRKKSEIEQKKGNEYNLHVTDKCFNMRIPRNKLSSESKQEIKKRMTIQLNRLISKDFNDVNRKYNKFNSEEIKKDYHFEDYKNEDIYKDNEDYKNYLYLDKLKNEYQNSIEKLEEIHKSKLNNIENNYDSQKHQALIEKNENSQKLKDYYDGMIKARKIYEEKNRDIEDKENHSDNFNLFSNNSFCEIANNKKKEIKKEKNEYDLEVFEYNDNNELKFEQKECIICLGEFENGEKLAILKCNHCYHDQCIKDWIKKAKGIYCTLCQVNRN